jgi:hypothetical protein
MLSGSEDSICVFQAEVTVCYPRDSISCGYLEIFPDMLQMQQLLLQR